MQFRANIKFLEWDKVDCIPCVLLLQRIFTIVKISKGKFWLTDNHADMSISYAMGTGEGVDACALADVLPCENAERKYATTRQRNEL